VNNRLTSFTASKEGLHLAARLGLSVHDLYSYAAFRFSRKKFINPKITNGCQLVIEENEGDRIPLPRGHPFFLKKLAEIMVALAPFELDFFATPSVVDVDGVCVPVSKRNALPEGLL
jgi:hypothetical protein